MATHGKRRARSRAGALLVVLGLVVVVMGIMPTAMASGNQFDVTRVPASSFQPVAAGGAWDFTVGVRQARFDATSPSIVDLAGGGVGLKNLDTGDDPQATNLKACGLSGGLPAASYVLPASWLAITSPDLPYTIPPRSNPEAVGDPYYTLGIRVNPPPGAALGTYGTLLKLETDKTANANFALCVQVIEPPTGNIIVRKVTDPQGSAQPFAFDPSWGDDFSLRGGESHDSGPLLTGPYSVAEIVPSDWSLANAICVVLRQSAVADQVVLHYMDPADIDLRAGETVTCTFTNWAYGRVIVNKAVPADAPAATFGFAASFGSFSLAGGASHDSGLIPPGVHSVAEVLPLAEGWSLASAFCDDGSSPSAIGVSPGETVTCTFVNRYEAVGGSLTILKMTSPAGGAGFLFGGTLGAFTLDHGGSQVFEDLAAGSYVVTEAPAAGWEFEDVTCYTAPGALVDYEVVGSGVVVNLAEGQDVTCKFANREEDTVGPAGSLTVIKKTVPAGGTGFEFDAGALGTFVLDDGGMETFTDLEAGSYTVTETPAEDWEFASVECDALDYTADGASVTVNLAEGEVAVCTFTNGELPYTGSSAWLPVLLAGLATVLMGLGAWVFGLMRRAEA